VAPAVAARAVRRVGRGRANREVLSWCVDQMFLFHHRI
jgi:hypothetical protein